MQGEFWPDIGPMSDAGTTSELSLLPTPQATAKAPTRSGTRKNELLLNGVAILSPGAFLASRYRLPAGVRLNVIRAGSGRISRAWFAFYDRSTSLWRIPQGCFPWADTTFSATLPTWGILRNGRLYRRVPLVRRTRGSVSFLLPTPTSVAPATETYNRAGNSCNLVKLREIAIADPLPLLSTPTATCSKREYSGQGMDAGHLSPAHAGGPINPEWLEHLMGFPIGWTALEDSATQWSQPWRNG